MADSSVAPPGFFPPPPGVKANFINPEQNTAGLVPLIGVFVPMSTIFLCLRLYTKARIIRTFGWEDVFITFAWMCNVSIMGLFLAGLKLGLGRHIWNVTLDDYLTFSKPTLSLPKIAILLFYLRVNPNKSFRYTVFAVVFIIACYTIGLMMAVVFPCTPVKKLWNPLTPGKCIDQNPIYLASVIINTSVDVIVLVLPIPMLIKLQVNTRTKVLLGSLFAFCSATVLISAVRIWSTTIILGNEDFTWDVANADSLAVCELNLTVVCGSVLTLRPFCRQHLPFLFGGRRSRPTDESPNGPNHALNFAGPSGPKSKSNYRAKIIGGRSGGFAGSNRPVKRSLWTGLGSTLVKDDDEDLESLSAELRTLAPNVRHPGDAGIGAGGLENRPVGEGGRPHVSDTAIGPRPGGLSDSYLPVSRTDVLDQGIMKTVSLDVR